MVALARTAAQYGEDGKAQEEDLGLGLALGPAENIKSPCCFFSEIIQRGTSLSCSPICALSCLYRAQVGGGAAECLTGFSDGLFGCRVDL